MDEIRARIRVDPDHSITGTAPPNVPPGEHEVLITLTPAAPRKSASKKPFCVDNLPTVDLGPWPEGMSLRREDIYGDDGR